MKSITITFFSIFLQFCARFQSLAHYFVKFQWEFFTFSSWKISLKSFTRVFAFPTSILVGCWNHTEVQTYRGLFIRRRRFILFFLPCAIAGRICIRFLGALRMWKLQIKSSTVVKALVKFQIFKLPNKICFDVFDLELVNIRYRTCTP